MPMSSVDQAVQRFLHCWNSDVLIRDTLNCYIQKINKHIRNIILVKAWIAFMTYLGAVLEFISVSRHSL
jgi:hypothetical protein